MSSTSRITTYTCPYCGEKFETEIYETIDANQDEDLRDRCVSGDLFRVSCPHCKKEYMIQFPLLYTDQNHKFVLWLGEQEVGDTLKQITAPLNQKGYRLRRTPTLAEFSEKIQIFEDGVDDRIVELAKYDSFIEAVDNKKAKPEDITSIEYCRTENEVMKINLRMQDKGMSFLIPIEGVQEEMDQNRALYKIDNETFPVINSDWIVGLFSREDPDEQAV